MNPNIEADTIFHECAHRRRTGRKLDSADILASGICLMELCAKRCRRHEMIALQNELSAESYRKDIGKEFEILVEGVSKRSKEQLFGRTQQNKVVVFDRGNHRIGDFVKVRVTEASSATLKGVEITDVNDN